MSIRGLFRKERCKHCGWDKKSHFISNDRLDQIHGDGSHRKQRGFKNSLLSCPGFEEDEMGLNHLGCHHWHR